MIVECNACETKNRVPAQRLGESSHCVRCKAALSPVQVPLAINSPAEFDELTARLEGLRATLTHERAHHRQATEMSTGRAN